MTQPRSHRSISRQPSTTPSSLTLSQGPVGPEVLGGLQTPAQAHCPGPTWASLLASTVASR